MLSVVHNCNYLLALLLIHSFRTSISYVFANIYKCFLPLSRTRAVGPMTLIFPSPSPCPRPLKAAHTFYVLSVEIAISLRVILTTVFHYGLRGDHELRHSRKLNLPITHSSPLTLWLSVLFFTFPTKTTLSGQGYGFFGWGQQHFHCNCPAVIIVCVLYCEHQIVYGISLSYFLCLPEALVSGC